MSLPPLQNVPCDVSLIVHSDIGRKPDWISFFIPMAWAVACVSIFFCVHVFISRFLSSGNAVIAQIFLCEISHNSLDFISVACDYEDFQRLDPSLLASCCPSVLGSVLKRPARLLHLQSLSYFSSPSFFCSTFELFRLVDLYQIAQIEFRYLLVYDGGPMKKHYPQASDVLRSIVHAESECAFLNESCRFPFRFMRRG
jgi:hypothetical protein